MPQELNGMCKYLLGHDGMRGICLGMTGKTC
jgi:hypothetical protein